MLVERTSSFAGGMNDSAISADDFAPDQVAYALNARVELDRSLACRGGSRLRATIVTAKGWGFGAFTLGGTDQYIVITGTSLAYSTDTAAATFTFLSSGSFTVGPQRASLAIMQHAGVDYLVIANGSDVPYYTKSGTAITKMAAAPMTGANRVAVFNRRLYATSRVAGESNNLYASKIDDFLTWAAPDGLVLPIETGDGDKTIRAIFDAGDHLLVFKRNSVSAVDGFGQADVIVTTGTRGISTSVGTLAFDTVKSCGPHGIAFLSERGIELYKAGTIQLITPGISNYISTIAWDGIAAMQGSQATACYVPHRDEYWIAWPGPSQVGVAQPPNDEGAIVNLKTGAVTLCRWHASAQPIAMCAADVVIDSVTRHTVMFCSSPSTSADIFAMDYSTLDNVAIAGTGGTAIDMRVRTRPYDFNQPLVKKRLRKVRLLGGSAASQSASVYTRSDGTDSSAFTATLPTTVNSVPVPVIVRTNARGAQTQVEVRAAGGARIAGIEVEANVTRAPL